MWDLTHEPTLMVLGINKIVVTTQVYIQNVYEQLDNQRVLFKIH